MKWFKFYGQDYLSDPKMLSLSASERSCWITILSFASVNDNGMITFISEEQIMTQAGVSPLHEEWQHTLGVLEKLKKLKMITYDNEMITVLNWNKRQETSLTSYERVKRYREKKRNDNAKITLEENRIEENRRDNINTLPPQPRRSDEDKPFDFSFEKFWKIFPKRENEKRCREIWSRKFLGPKSQMIIDFVEKAKKTRRWNDTKYIPGPIAFLTNERWNDDLAAYADGETQDEILKA